VVAEADAVRLLVERVRDKPDQRDGENAATLREIYERLDGLPLAISRGAAIQASRRGLLKRLRPARPCPPAASTSLLATRCGVEWSHDLL
jgi:hypothetical protein